MPHKLILATSVLHMALMLAACSSGSPAVIDRELPARWWMHVEFLADDDMAGRQTGSPEHRKAAGYVAAQFERAGVAPAGTNGYLQPVTLRSRRIDESRSSLALVRDDAVVPVALGDAAVFGMRIEPAPQVDAALVFAGHGLQIPEVRHDDFADLDVQGKVVVYLAGSPSAVAGALSAHVQSAGERWRTLQRLGAIGTIAIPNPGRMDVPWARSAPNRLNASMALADASFDDTAGQQVSITFNPARAEALFEGAPHTFADLVRRADEGGTLPRFALPARVRAVVAVAHEALTSDNVVGIVRGSDPALADEYVVLTAHLDHVGIGAPIDGDAIYNGAMDNASGIATLIEIASMTAAARPARSVVFVAVTAEEKGLLGSRYFAMNPTVPRAAMVANINMDMFLPLFPMKILTVMGLDESDLGDAARVVATEMGVEVQADLEPQRNRFIRSDQYSFIRQGVPALALKVGYAPDSPEAANAADWTRQRYHAPSDDLAQPIDRDAAAAFTDLVGRLTVRVANGATRPAWRDDSFFRRFAPTR